MSSPLTFHPILFSLLRPSLLTFFPSSFLTPPHPFPSTLKHFIHAQASPHAVALQKYAQAFKSHAQASPHAVALQNTLKRF